MSLFKDLKEKILNMHFAKTASYVIFSCLYVFFFAYFAKSSARPVYLTALYATLIYAAVIIAMHFLWKLINKKITNKRGGEIEPVLGNMTLDLMVAMDQPVIISDLSGTVIWFNKAFVNVSGSKNGYYRKNISHICPNTLSDFLSSEDETGVETTAFSNHYKVKAYKVSTPSKDYCITVWNNENELKELQDRYNSKNTVVCYVVIDNLDELLQHVQDKYREVTNDIAQIITDWAQSANGIVKEYQRNKYIFIFEEKHLETFVADKFPILDKVRNVRVGDSNLPVTVSIGISGNGDSLEQKENEAQAALDMALQRGGDQAVVKTGETLKFYGGRTQSVQKRTKVRSRVTANELVSLMSNSGNVLIMGHANPDFDCFGACIGIARIAMFCGVGVKIAVDVKDRNISKCFDYLAGLPDYAHIFVDPHEAIDLINHDTLLVIADVNNKKQFQAPELAESVNNIVYIDHHRKTAEFDTKPLIAYIEPSASSTCELVAELLEQILSSGTLPHEEADLLFAGMVLDTKQFSKNTGVRTFSAGFYLQNEGANPQTVQKLFSYDIEDLKREARFESNVKIYRNKFAIATNFLNEDSVSVPQDRIAAAKAADKLLNIENVAATFAVCMIEDVVHISARSSGEINVQVILEKLNGGGRFDSAATQLKDTTVADALVLLKNAIDDYLDNN